MWPGLQVRPWTQCWKAAQTNIGTLKVTSIYQIRGQGSHDSHAGWKTSRRMYVVRGAADNEAKNIHADHLRLEIWINMTDAAQRKEKQKWAIGSSTMRESWEWFLSLIRQMQSSRKPLKTNWKSRKFRCQQVRLARSGEESTGDLLRGTCDTRKTKYACIVEADESTRKRWEGTLHKDHKDHVAGKEIISLNHYNLVHEFIPMPQAMKVLEAKAAVDKEWEKLEKKSMATDESQKQKKKWSMKQGEKAKQCVSDGYLSSQEFGVGTKTSKIPRSSRAPRWKSERWFRLLRSIYRARFVRVTDDSCKSNGCRSKATRMRRTSSRRSISLHPSRNGRCTVFVEKCKVRKSRYLDSSTKTQMAEMVQHGRPSRSSWTKSVRSKLGMLIRTPWKGVILVCVCGRHKTGCEEIQHWPNVESTDESCRFGRNNIIPWPRLFGLHSTRVRNKQRYCRQLQKQTCLNPGSPQDHKTTMCREMHTSLHGPVMWKVMQELCGAVLRAGEQNNSAAVQSRNSMPWWPSIQRRGIGICWRISKSTLSKFPEMSAFGTHW